MPRRKAGSEEGGEGSNHDGLRALGVLRTFAVKMNGEGQGGHQRGFFLAFGYSHDAQQECAAFHKRTGRIIKLLTVQEILDEEHVQKM